MNKQCFQLFASFFKIGAFTFGGGWAMISIIEKEIVEKKKWIEKEEFLDLLAIAQSLPGILAVNISVAVGDKIKGKIGSMCAALGTILPSFLIILKIKGNSQITNIKMWLNSKNNKNILENSIVHKI